MRERYENTLQHDLAKNYVKPVEKTKIAPNKIWYLPHHPVINPRKPDKVRRVSNAASKFRSTSLNENLLTGPDLLANLVGLLLRFREQPVGVLADIEGMFMQIAIRHDDQAALRFLWQDNDLVREFQFTRLIFGATCSPSCAIYVLRRCAEDHQTQFPAVFHSILNNFYMDDFVQSFSSVDEAKQLTANLRLVLQKGGFHLTKFISNSTEILQSLPNDDVICNQTQVRVLGQTWNLQNDNFETTKTASAVPDSSKCTLRQLFSLLSSTFDPLGLLAPFLVRFKVLIQTIWKSGKSWDALSTSRCLARDQNLP